MIDLRSDTVTKPSDEMREKMLTALVGDDVYGEDPTVNELETYAAQLFGKEAALFVTSGTQGNQAAILSYTQPGQEIIMDNESHVFLYEGAATSAFAGVQSRTLAHRRGQIAIDDIEAAVRGEDIHFPETSLIWLENSHNRSGGSILPLTYIKEVYQLARSYHVPVHIDGARIFNASVASNIAIKEYAAYANSIQFCLSKGLGAPVGSVLVGDKAFIDRARKKRKMLGGGLRQAGVIAAPGLLALKSNVDRLTEDHENAKRLAKAIEQYTALKVVNKVETNIILVETSASENSSQEWLQIFKAKGILAVAFAPTVIRFTTHLDISKEDIDEVISTLKNL
ncbi:low-specificity L-threonine aldolase [Evansella cellulosilytica]|uniref:Threonine aldolase n=1 Tax=Evansella cellulosilytica (strain ATCC 21833 / DSM 2522 / FERM P-1141 / JCM 9156 / N-4) TaxID=649639 RepID=E6U1R1_EVAC2|nr:low-specificity L-threonine aldolase [Evansella cellulosilytica]ADU31558.1 Threonine aldolase [Evansella cellulosilytica DSM 2522]